MIRDFFRRLKWRVLWSLAGWRDAWANEPSLRSWVWANGASALAAFVLPLSMGERALILSLGVVVLAVELINTAIERVVDRISSEEHDLSRRAKDAGSAGVALAALAAGLAWAVVLWRLGFGGA
ncbi:MAG: diacylglycerol kinase [Alphaproteobacteria bacterium]|nr:MAG: diacylglycerol kinase [Alphaproteobacteria bacterium]